MAQTSMRVVRRIPSEALFTTGQYRKPQMVVAAYARASTEKEEQEDSFERQVQHYTNLITSKPEWQFGASTRIRVSPVAVLKNAPTSCV